MPKVGEFFIDLTSPQSRKEHDVNCDFGVYKVIMTKS